MKRDPFTLRVALDKSGSARGELYLDDGVSYGHTKGDFVWREFVAESDRGKKGLRLSCVDLGKAKPEEAVDGVSLTTYNPENSFAADLLKDVRVEKVVVVGLGAKPLSIKVEGSEEELVWEYTPGVASSQTKGGKVGVLVIKDPKVLVRKDWAIVIQ
jgi:alpha 1,3-glucosidase